MRQLSFAGTAAAALVGLLIAVPSATAAGTVKTVTIKTPKGPGPAKYNRVRVLEQGDPKAKNIFLFNPGTSAGAGMMVQDGAEIVKKLPGWQVWSIDRRENWLEDPSELDKALAGKATSKQVFDYYLGWLGNSAITDHFQPVADKDVEYAKDWGMKVAVDDIHAVVKQARKGGRRVVLAGHSLGGSITVAYATWDFAGRAGARDLAAIVLMDGASGAGTQPTAADAQKSLDDLDAPNISPFADIAGVGVPWASGVFAELGGTLALTDPESLSPLQSFPLLPASLKPDFPVTNRAAFGYGLDTQTSPANLGLIHMHMGHLAASGDPRDWVDGELVPVERGATLFARPGIGGAAWYHPTRLSLDSRAVWGGKANPAQKVLDVDATHGADLGIPIYAFQTDLSKGGVVKSVKALAKTAHLKKSQVTIVDRASTTSHLDPLAASPAKNDFLKTIVPFLKKLK